MLKQIYNKEQLTKALTSTEVWNWDIPNKFTNVEQAIEGVCETWAIDGLSLKSLSLIHTKNNKPIFHPSTIADAFAIKLLDIFIRRIYKIKQSDRNRIIRQIKSILKDTGKHHILRLDIKDFYESIKLNKIVQKFKDDSLLSPESIGLLNSLNEDLINNHNISGLPRGLTLSPTLAELYLEDLDKHIAKNIDVIYFSRYVDDIFIVTSTGKENSVLESVENFLKNENLHLRKNEKHLISSTINLYFDYLGYSIQVTPQSNKENKINLSISKSKIDKIKSRITLSLLSNNKNGNISLLQKRLRYLSMLKTIKRSANGDLLVGIAYNYQYVTDNFNCLKSIDGFLINALNNPRFNLSTTEIDTLSTISFFGNATKAKICNFSKKQVIQIMGVWKNV